MEEQILNRRERILKKIYIAILLLFSVEYLGWGEISIYRVGILPLCLIGISLIISQNKKKIYSTYILLTTVYMIFFSMCLYATDGNYLFPILTLPLALYFFSFLTLRKNIEVDYSMVFVWYSLPHIISLLLGVENYDGGRFAGLHEDPNFCGIFLGFSIIACVELLFRNSITKKWKLLILLLISLDFVLLFTTGSRGAILSLIIIASLLFLNTKIKTIWKILTILVVCFLVWRVYQYVLTLPDWVSPSESVIDSVLCRFKPDSMAEGSHRSELWDAVINKLKNSNPLVPIGMKAAMRGQVNDYPHNTFLDIMVDNGFLVGVVVSVVIVFWGIKSYFIVAKRKFFGYENVFMWCSLSVLLQLTFLSAIQQKIFWICVFFLFYMAKKKHRLSNTYLR